MRIQLAELSDTELDAFLEDFIQLDDTPHITETVPESKSGDQYSRSVALAGRLASISLRL
jgi:hypothetical protein